MGRRIRNSIFLQLLLIVSLVLLTLSGILGVSQRYIRQIERTNAENIAGSFLQQADDALSGYSDALRYQAAYLCRYSFVQELCLGIAEDVAAKEAQISSIYSQIAVQEHEITGAVFYNMAMERVSCVGREFSLPQRQNYIRREVDLNADWYYGDGEDYHYAFFYPIFDNSVSAESRQIGMCVFLLDHWLFDGIVRNILGETSGAILLSDSHNLNLSFHAAGIVPEDVSMEELKQNPDYVYREGSWQNGIRIASAASISGNTEGSQIVRRPLMLTIGLAFLMMLLLVFFYYYQMIRPIHEINRFILRAGRHPDDRLKMRREDDIGVVARSLDRMLDENQAMLEEVRNGKIRLYETQLAREKMEILAYRNQINPHFLYNTLSCIRDIALINDEDAIAEIAMALSDIFRYAVKGSNLVTVKDEAAYLAKYAKIIEYRFGGKIRIQTEVPEEVEDCQIIRFLLQPLVENAVFHGLESRLEPGTVLVRVEAEGTDRLRILVTDDGCGMSAKRLEELREMLEHPGEESGIGISNIVKRLKLFYGEAYGMSVDSAPDQGTSIRISIPGQITEVVE